MGPFLDGAGKSTVYEGQVIVQPGPCLSRIMGDNDDRTMSGKGASHQTRKGGE